MALPEATVAIGWIGLPVFDADGQQLGTCNRVYADDATGAPEWITLDASGSGSSIFLPLLDATGTDGGVRLGVRQEAVLTAPQVGRADAGLTPAEEEQLYGHYGIEVSRSASTSVLPSEDGSPATAGDAPTTRLRSLEGRATVSPAVPDMSSGDGQDMSADATGGTAEATAPAPSLDDTSTVAASPAHAEPAGTGRQLPVLAGAAGSAAVAAAAALMWRRRSEPEPAPVRTGRSLGTAAGTAAGIGLNLGDAAVGQLNVAAQRAGDAAVRVGGAARSAAALTGVAASSATTKAEKAAQKVSSTVSAAATVPKSVAEETSELTETVLDSWRSTMKKMTTLLGFATGYVLGSRAGRERYEQIKRGATQAAARPEVQQLKEKASSSAPAFASKVPGIQGKSSGSVFSRKGEPAEVPSPAVNLTEAEGSMDLATDVVSETAPEGVPDSIPGTVPFGGDPSTTNFDVESLVAPAADASAASSSSASSVNLTEAESSQDIAVDAVQENSPAGFQDRFSTS